MNKGDAERKIEIVTSAQVWIRQEGVVDKYAARSCPRLQANSITKPHWNRCLGSGRIIRFLALTSSHAVINLKLKLTVDKMTPFSPNAAQSETNCIEYAYNILAEVV
jgi:hypothetical protein